MASHKTVCCHCNWYKHSHADTGSVHHCVYLSAARCHCIHKYSGLSSFWDHCHAHGRRVLAISRPCWQRYHRLGRKQPRVVCASQHQQFWDQQPKMSARLSDWASWSPQRYHWDGGYHLDIISGGPMPENLSSSQEFQQRKLSSIKRTVRTASCQHVHFFPSFKDLFFCIFTFACRCCCIELQKTKKVNLRLHVFLFL